MVKPIGTEKILVVTEADPWSVWTISGITRRICEELRSRGLLYGAIGVSGGSRIPSLGPCSRGKEFVRRQFRRFFRFPRGSRFVHESEGHVGKALSLCPEGTVVLYCFVTPAYDTNLPIRRFRFMDLSLMDAVRTGGYGLDRLSAEEVRLRFDEQLAALSGAEGVVTLSSYAADAISRDFNYPRDRITPIGAGPAVLLDEPMARNIERYSKRRILFIGRAWERKGGPLLLDAFRLLRRKMPDATLVVAGPPECPTVESGVEYHPPINKDTQQGRDALELLYRNASVFCMPSECETWGLVYVEASQRRLPIVGFSDWAVPDIVENGVTGLLGSERKPEVIAELLEEALRSPERLEQMGLAAEARVKDVLGWSHVVDRLLSRILPDALNGREPVWL